MNAIEIIKAVQAENKAELSSFVVDCWTTEEADFVVYHRPFTLDDVGWISRQSKGNKAKELALTVIRKALDSEGNKMFTLKDLNFILKGVKSSDIVDIVNMLNRDDNGVDYEKE